MDFMRCSGTAREILWKDAACVRAEFAHRVHRWLDRIDSHGFFLESQHVCRLFRGDYDVETFDATKRAKTLEHATAFEIHLEIGRRSHPIDPK